MTTLITDSNTLSKELDRLKGVRFVAVDTEFTRRRTFYSKLELVQLSADSVELCVDAAQCGDVSALSDLFESQSTTFILHSASQDLDALIHHASIPKQIFDTQIAAVLCGYDKVSYQDLVGSITDKVISKTLKTSNWSKRPLSNAQIEYAMDDVRYLHFLHENLHQKLQQLNRVHWLEEECERQVAEVEHLHGNGIEDCWKSYSFGASLAPVNQHIARDLLIWRERSARYKDLPRQWVLRDDAIVSISTRRPQTVQQLSGRHKVGKGKWIRWLQDILDIANQPRDKHLKEIWSQDNPLNREEKDLVGRILSEVGKLAEQHQIPASLICTRGEAKSLVRGGRKIRLLSGWRHEITESTVLPIVGA